MSWARVAIAAGVAVVSGASFVAGKLWGSSTERKAHEPIRRENETLRNERNQLVSFFEGRAYNYEEIIARIYNEKPRNKAALSVLLKRYSLSDMEIDRISKMLSTADFYDSRAA